jgi:hypothetical protein
MTDWLNRQVVDVHMADVSGGIVRYHEYKTIE